MSALALVLIPAALGVAIGVAACLGHVGDVRQKLVDANWIIDSQRQQLVLALDELARLKSPPRAQNGRFAKRDAA